MTAAENVAYEMGLLLSHTVYLSLISLGSCRPFTDWVQISREDSRKEDWIRDSITTPRKVFSRPVSNTVLALCFPVDCPPISRIRTIGLRDVVKEPLLQGWEGRK